MFLGSVSPTSPVVFMDKVTAWLTTEVPHSMRIRLSESIILFCLVQARRSRCSALPRPILIDEFSTFLKVISRLINKVPHPLLFCLAKSRRSRRSALPRPILIDEFSAV